jgi:PAS domain S-box-containing protein
VPHYICPKCKQRSVDVDGLEGFSREAPSCRHCGFGFLFELQEDYYPGPMTGFVVCDQQGRVLATGNDFFELSGYREEDLVGREVTEIVAADPNPVSVALEWGVRRLGERVSLTTRAGLEKPVLADLFPALDEDGGLLVALTPAR